MAEFTIRTYGDPVLRTPGEPVREFGPALRTLGDAMLVAMRKAKGIGLAAQQVFLGDHLQDRPDILRHAAVDEHEALLQPRAGFRRAILRGEDAMRGREPAPADS